MIRLSFLISLYIIFIIISIVFFTPINAEIFRFNTLADNEVEVDLDVTFGRIDLDTKEIDLNIDFVVKGPEFFELYLKEPDSASTYLNGTKEKNASWYKLDPQVSKLTDITIELDGPLSLWPFDSYSAYLYVMFRGDLTTKYNLPLEPSMHDTLFRNKDWKGNIYPDLINSRDKFPNWVFKDEPVTVMIHKITLLHTDEYIGKNIVYFFIPTIVFGIIFVYFLLPKHNLGWLITLYLGSLTIIFGTVLQIRQIIPTDFTILELLFWVASASHTIVFIFLIRKTKGETRTKIQSVPTAESKEITSIKNTKIKDHIDALLQQFLKFKQTKQGHLVDLGTVSPIGGILRIDELLERFPSYKNLLCHLYTDPNNKKVYDRIYELNSIKTYFKNFEEERNKIEREKINEILTKLETQANFEQNGQIFLNKSTNEILNIYDLKDFLKYHLILENPDPISLVEPSDASFVGFYELKFPSKGLLGHLVKNNGEFLVKELNKLTNELLDSTRQFHTKLSRQRELLPIIENYIEEILHEVELRGEPLGGCCFTCLTKNFRISQEMKQFRTKLSQIPWSELNLRTPELYKKETDFIELQLVDPGIYEIIIDDPGISDIDESHGMPYVYVNDDTNNPVKMIQSTEGKWHAYVGKKLSQTELISKIFHFYKPNNHPNVLIMTGLGQVNLKENEWPFIQQYDLKEGSPVIYVRGGKNHTVKI